MAASQTFPRWQEISQGEDKKISRGKQVGLSRENGKTNRVCVPDAMRTHTHTEVIVDVLAWKEHQDADE